MLTKILLMAVLFAGQPFSYAQSPEILDQGPKLVRIYLSNDSTEIATNWKLEEDETVDIPSLLKMQADVFNEPNEPTDYLIRESYDIHRKTRTATLTLKNVFGACPSAELSCSMFKGKKKKDRFHFTEITIASEEKPANSFIDSLCNPYLAMLERNAIDSLVVDALNYREIMQGIEQLEERKEEAKEFMTTMFETTRNFLVPELEKIDGGQPFSFHSCTLESNVRKTMLVVQFNGTAKDATPIRIRFNFQLGRDGYDLVGVGTASGPVIKQF